jgi:hypothetical protein
MAFHNTNWTAVPLSLGTYTLGDLGNGITGSTVHEIFCTTDGEIIITAFGGGEFSWVAKSGQSVKVVTAKAQVKSGAFVGFKTNLQQGYRAQVGI